MSQPEGNVPITSALYIRRIKLDGDTQPAKRFLQNWSNDIPRELARATAQRRHRKRRDAPRTVIHSAFWFVVIGGTISVLLAGNGDGLAAIIVLSVTLLLVIAYVTSRTLNLARAVDRAEMKQAQRARPKPPMN